MVKKEIVPRNCPKPTCLTLSNISFGLGGDVLTIDSNPPVVKNKQKPPFGSRRPICFSECIFEGNSNIAVEIDENQKGKVEINRRWRRDV